MIVMSTEFTGPEERTRPMPDRAATENHVNFA